MSNILVYLLDGKIYINLTNRCTNDCIFCLRKDKDDVVGQTLWLDDENSTAQDVIKQFEVKRNELLSTNLPFTETIFCGYGEPMLKFDELKQVAKYIKEKYPKTKIRVNTNGHANYIYKKNIVPWLHVVVIITAAGIPGVCWISPFYARSLLAVDAPVLCARAV